MNNFRYIKHVSHNEISFLAINENGRFCRVTINKDRIDQIVGIFDADMDDDRRLLYINRMIAVGSEISGEDFEEVQNFYSKNTARMLFGELTKEELVQMIQKHNVGDNKKVEEVKVDKNGNFEIDF